eukprot:g26007.t1
MFGRFASSSRLQSKLFRRFFGTHAEHVEAAAGPSAYPGPVAVMHWLVAPTMIGTVGAVIIAQGLDKSHHDYKEDYGRWMWRHKSLGLLTGMLVVPRLVTRLALNSKLPASLPGLLGSAQESVVYASHAALYGFMIVMPATGVAMGYYSGFGVPFFAGMFPGLAAEKVDQNKALAGKMYNIHATIGKYGKYLIPLHVAGAGVHAAKGQSIMQRINPMVKAAEKATP